MPEVPAPGAPPATPPAGEAPPATPPPAGDPPASPPVGGLESLPEWAQKELKATRSEAATARTKLKTLEDAQLSEADKLKNRAAEFEKQAEDRATELRLERAHREVERTARRLNIVDEETALALISTKIEYGSDGQPTNIEPLLTALIKAKPFLVGEAQGSPGNPGNPPRGGAALTLDDFKGKSSDWINQHWGEYEKLMTKK